MPDPIDSEESIISLIHDGDDLVTRIAHEHELPHRATAVYVEQEDGVIPDLPDGYTALLVNTIDESWEFWIKDYDQSYSLESHQVLFQS